MFISERKFIDNKYPHIFLKKNSFIVHYSSHSNLIVTKVYIAIIKLNLKSKVCPISYFSAMINTSQRKKIMSMKFFTMIILAIFFLILNNLQIILEKVDLI